MKKAALALTMLTVSGFAAFAQQDPYPWCAVRSMGDAVESCYFLTLAQCRASLAGGDEFCRRNYLYTGRRPDAVGPRR